MTDIVDRLRHAAGDLINGDVDDGTVETQMLCEAADEIEDLRGALRQFVAACETAPPTSLMVEISTAYKAAKYMLKGELGG